MPQNELTHTKKCHFKGKTSDGDKGANGDFVGGANLLQNWATTGFDNAT